MPLLEAAYVVVSAVPYRHGVEVAAATISALARTTVFPATALAHLISQREVLRPGVLSMGDAVLAPELMPELAAVGIEATAL
jgi:saccharopine dehydrogenase-like NADP-dependent oxidoreductase